MNERVCLLPSAIVAQYVRATIAFGVVAIVLLFAIGALIKSPGVMLAALIVAGLSYVSQLATTYGELLYQFHARVDGTAPLVSRAASAQRIGNYVMASAIGVHVAAVLYIVALVLA